MNLNHPKAEFIARHRAKVAGVIALGTRQVRHLFAGPMTEAKDFGSAMLELATTADRLLEELYDDLCADRRPLAGNGAHPQRKANP